MDTIIDGSIFWSRRHPPNALGGCLMIIDLDPQPGISVIAISDHYISYISITILCIHYKLSLTVERCHYSKYLLIDTSVKTITIQYTY